VDYNYAEVLNEVLQAMADAGIAPASPALDLDGQKHRYKIHDDKGREKSGEYCIYMDERPAGFFKSYRASHGCPYVTWVFSRGPQQFKDEQERKQFVEDCERRAEERERQKETAQKVAIDKVRRRWSSATPLVVEGKKTDHPYVQRKKLSDGHGARLLGQDILVPMFNEFGELMTVQSIPADPEKKKMFPRDSLTRGNFFVIPEEGASAEAFFASLAPGPEGGPPDPAGVAKPSEGDGAVPEEEEKGEERPRAKRPRVWLCEGWATGASIREATRERVVVAFSAGNLMSVGAKIRMLWPSCEIILAPDFDHSRGNAGMAHAFEIEDKLGFAVVPPPFDHGDKGTDWNDYHCEHGMKQTRAALADGLRRAYCVPDFELRQRYNLLEKDPVSMKPLGTIPNLERLLAYVGITTRYNEIGKNVEFGISHRRYSWDDEANAAVAYITSKCTEHGMPTEKLDGYLIEIACRNAYSPVMDWVLSRPWDGEPRMQTLVDTLETPKEYAYDLKYLLVTRWLISAMAAAASRKREFFSRGVLVLQGAQSKGKTSWLRRLVPPDSGWFCEGVSLNPTDKDDLKSVVSHWIVELGELDGTLRKTDIARLKAFITKGTDVVRLPWAKKFSKFPRRTVLCASVNPKEVLVDATGNSRWWMIPCEKVNYQHEIDMQQMWAEVYCRYLDGEKWYLTHEEEELLNRSNRDFEMIDPVADLLSSKLSWNDDQIYWEERTVTEILIECGMEKVSKGEASRAGMLLRDLGAVDVGRRHNGRYMKAPTKKR